MKKTMFITSVIMVVVMAIALTTSSLAWFSAGGSAAVTTQSFQVTATAGAAKGIAISHYNNLTGYNWVSELELTTTGNSGLKPVVPFAKKATGIDSADLLAALVGGTEYRYLSEAEYTADYAKYVAWVAKQAEVDAYNSSEPAEPMVNDKPAATYAALYAAYNAQREIPETPEFAAGDISYANLVACHYIGNNSIGTNDASADYAAYMVGAKFDTNKNFTDSVYRDGFYTDTFYITNTSSGSSNNQGEGAVEIKLDATIDFFFESYQNVSEDPEQEDYRYVDVSYTRPLRGGTKYDTDATLCVAVLAKVSEFDSNMINYLNKNKAANEPVIHDETGDAWEIIAYTDSKHWTQATMPETAIVMGKDATYFDAGSPIAQSTTNIGITGLNKSTTDTLRPERNYVLSATDLDAVNTLFFGEDYADDEDIEPYGLAAGDSFDGEGGATTVTLDADIKTIKVVAWYDSSLVNTNAANANLKFKLTFNIAD